MTALEEEQKALTEFILSKPKGSIWREIAETRLSHILYEETKFKKEMFVRKAYPSSIPVINLATGKIFTSVRLAAKSIKVDKVTIIKDLERKTPIYNFQRLSDYL